MARTTAVRCACRFVSVILVVITLVCPSALAFAPLSIRSQTVALPVKQMQVPRPSAAADVTTLKRDIVHNLRALRAQRATCEEAAAADIESHAALKEITAKLYNAPARTAWTTATTSAVAAGVAQSAVSMAGLPGTQKSSSSSGGAAVLERPPQLEFVTVEEAKEPKLYDKYKVMLFNDSMNSREYVARSLVQVVGMPESSAFDVMLKAHKDGMAQVGIWVGEIAEAYCDQLKTRGIVSEVMPVD